MNVERISLSFLLLLAFGTIFYIWYLVWFQTANYRNKVIERYENLPNWYPFRGFIIWSFKSNFFIWYLRIFATIGIPVILVLLLKTITN